MTHASFDCPPPDPRPRAPRLKTPARAVDCHAHVIGPAHRYPFVANRSYTPPDALLPDYLNVLRVLGFQRAVLVQPSMHGEDNTVMMNAVAEAGIDMRAVVVVPANIGEAELAALHRQGARGVRINLIYAGGNVGLAEVAEIGARIRPFGWHIEMLVDVSQLGDRVLELSALPVPVSIAHFGHLPAERGVSDTGFAALMELVRRGNTWVKLSAAYRVSGDGPPYADVRPFCEALVEACSDRMLWGTDWPHTACRSRMPNDGELLDLLGDWIGDHDTLTKILVSNPAALYGFDRM